jgi:hypothetical protein
MTLKRMALAATAMLVLAAVTAPGLAAADDRKIVWRMVSLWTVIGGPPGLPSRYERDNGDFATKSECLEQLEKSRDRLEADRAEAELLARRAGAVDADYRATDDCAPRYADATQ